MSDAKDHAFEEFYTEYQRLLSPGCTRADADFAFTMGWIHGKDDAFNQRMADAQARYEAIKGDYPEVKL